MQPKYQNSVHSSVRLKKLVSAGMQEPCVSKDLG